MRADVVVVDPDAASHRVVATFAAGKLCYLDAAASARLALAPAPA
jgi:hypothetical protein